MATLERTRQTVFTDETKADTYILYAPGDPGQIKFGSMEKKAIGIAKLAGIYMKTFLTVIGTDPHDLNRGTEFAGLLGSNYTDDESLVFIAQQSVKDAMEQVQDFQSHQYLPADEILQFAELTLFDLDEGGLDMSIDVVSQSGVRANIKVPKIEQV